MDLIYTGLAGILLLALGNGMNGAATRRRGAVEAGRSHSQTGELLVNMPRHYLIRAWVMVGVGIALILLAFAGYMFAFPIPVVSDLV